MAISKIIYKTSPQDAGTVWMDATPATATASDITAPKTAMLADGVMTTGTGSGGGGDTNPTAEPKDVNFIDYDGTIRYSYTAVEAQALSALPANPTHAGLTAQGWNWTLAEIKAQLTAMPNAPVWVGQMYITQSGDTEIDVSFVDSARLSPTMTIAVNGEVTVDWGDNTTSETVTGTSLTSRKAVPHIYASTGDYTIKIHVVSGSFTFYSAVNYQLLRKNTEQNENRVYSNAIKHIRLGSGITTLGSYAFCYCQSLATITIPSSVSTLSGSTFYYCYKLKSFTLPYGITNTNSSLAGYCYGLETVSVPSTLTAWGSSSFSYCVSLQSITIPQGTSALNNTSIFTSCYALTSISIPSGVSSFGGSSLASCCGLGEIHFLPTTPPTVSNTNVFYLLPTDCKIYVPTGHKSDYTGATNYPSSATYTYIEE